MEYKTKKFGSELQLAPRFYPSSKTCSHCGHIQDMPLKERVFDCEKCHIQIDRDLNAAINLSKRFLLVQLGGNKQTIKATKN
jgi:putative transposase